jgi:hypothetical protein
VKVYASSLIAGIATARLSNFRIRPLLCIRRAGSKAHYAYRVCCCGRFRIGAPASAVPLHYDIKSGFSRWDQLSGIGAEGAPSQLFRHSKPNPQGLNGLRKNSVEIGLLRGLLHQNPSPKGDIPVAHVA